MSLTEGNKVEGISGNTTDSDSEPPSVNRRKNVVLNLNECCQATFVSHGLKKTCQVEMAFAQNRR